jgi:uncharacterized membrane protein YcaP (DUF421 family)
MRRALPGYRMADVRFAILETNGKISFLMEG